MLQRAGYSIYKHMPLPLQHAMVSAFGLVWKAQRLGGQFQAAYQGFLQREHFTPEQWQAYTDAQLQALLSTAFSRVPYYQQVGRELGLTPADLTTFTAERLPELPPLSKATPRDDPHALLVGGQPQRRHKVFHTSGSTGTPVATYWLPNEHQRSIALKEARSHRFAGVGLSMPRGTFGGRLVEPNPSSDGPFYRYNIFEQQVYFSAFHIAPQNVPQYLAAMRRHNTQWLTGYGHSIYQLARLVLSENLNAPTLKAVVTTSEKITAPMRHTIETAFNTRLFEEYGALENVFFASECEHGRLHISPDAGVIEIVDEDFQPVPPGTPGEVLATGFIRPSQPMIRYRIGDIATLSAEGCPCGRSMPVLKEVLGRIEDTVYGPDGRRMVRFHGIFVDQPYVEEGQIVQEALDRIRVRVVPKPGFSDNDRADITRRIHQRLTEAVTVEVETVTRIERTPAGKMRAVISKLSPEEIERIRQP